MREFSLLLSVVAGVLMMDIVYIEIIHKLYAHS